MLCPPERQYSAVHHWKSAQHFQWQFSPCCFRATWKGVVAGLRICRGTSFWTWTWNGCARLYGFNVECLEQYCLEVNRPFLKWIAGNTWYDNTFRIGAFAKQTVSARDKCCIQTDQGMWVTHDTWSDMFANLGNKRSCSKHESAQGERESLERAKVDGHRESRHWLHADLFTCLRANGKVVVR